MREFDTPRRRPRRRRRSPATGRRVLLVMLLLLIPVVLGIGGYAAVILVKDLRSVKETKEPDDPPVTEAGNQQGAGSPVRTPPQKTGDALTDSIAETDRLDPGWRLAEIEAARKIPEPNSATHVLAARRLLPKVWPPTQFREALEQYSPQRQLSPGQLSVLTRELRKYQPALRRARKLADCPQGRYQVRWDPTVLNTLLPHLQEARAVAFQLEADVLQRAAMNDPDGALASCRGVLNAGRSIGDEPTAISQLVRLAVERIALRSLEHVLAQGQPSEAALASMQQALEDEVRYPTLRVTVRAERAGAHELLSNLRSGRVRYSEIAEFKEGNAPGPAEMARIEAKIKQNLKPSHVWMLRFFNRVFELTKLPIHQQMPKIKSLEETIKGAPLLARFLTPAFGKIALAYHAIQAQMRCAIVALALERYRRAHQRWPDSLSDLKPTYLSDIPIDPYDGAPIRYVRTEDGLTVYSIGRNLLDDGGKVQQVSSYMKDPDLGFRLWDVTHRRQPPR